MQAKFKVKFQSQELFDIFFFFFNLDSCQLSPNHQKEKSGTTRPFLWLVNSLQSLAADWFMGRKGNHSFLFVKRLLPFLSFPFLLTQLLWSLLWLVSLGQIFDADWLRQGSLSKLGKKKKGAERKSGACWELSSVSAFTRRGISQNWNEEEEQQEMKWDSEWDSNWF